MNEMYDVIVAGAGPAGLSAAIYLARARYRVLVIEKEKIGGQITITSEIVNYPGVEKTSGKALTENMRVQAENFGAQFVIGEITELDLDGEIKRVETAHGQQYLTFGVVLALGASPRKVGFNGEKEFQGRGVAYCATCDGEFFTGREVLVIGGGFAAVEESIFLTKYASKITILVREEDFTCAAGVSEQLEDFTQIEVRFHTELIEASGDSVVKYAKLKDNKTGEISEYYAADGGNFGIFVFAGYQPATDLVKGKVLLNEQGYIVTDQDQKTSVEGVYAAGDVCIKKLRQVVTAVSDGAVAATVLEKYVSECRERKNLPKKSISNEEIQKRAEARKERANHKREAEHTDIEGTFINSQLKEQLSGVFAKFVKKVTVAAVLGRDAAALELEGFLEELKGLHEMVETVAERGSEEEHSYLDIRTEKGSSGIRFYSVPGGHEFNSFVIALYNVAGPGQQIGEREKKRIEALTQKHRIQVMTTLSCTNCPDVVMGTQKIASLSQNIEAEMYDLSKFPELKEKYQIMAVPCMIIDEEKVYFGKRGLEEILEILENC